jgi:nucleotide-binding universal stress UspA family protein
MEDASERPVIVVGVDGSHNAERALAWAIEDAARRSASIRVVTAWHIPLGGYAGHGSAVSATVSLEDSVREFAESIAAAASRKVREEANLPVETHVVEGQPAEALIEEARTAALLVIGASSRPAIPLVLSGSVSIQCALNSHGPTAIIR